MREGPDISRIASLVGDPARANMLTALMCGTALTASELALEAGVTLQTASSHLAKLTDGGLLRLAAQGRHRYFAIAGPQVASMLEAITGVAEAVGPRRVRPGPRDKSLREARACYDHIAGDLAVAMLDGFIGAGVLVHEGGALRIGAAAPRYFASRGVDLDAVARQRRPLCGPASTGACVVLTSPARWVRHCSTRCSAKVGRGARPAAGRSPSRRRAVRPLRAPSLPSRSTLRSRRPRPVLWSRSEDRQRKGKKGARHPCRRPSRFASAEAYYSAACRLTLRSAMSLSFLSVAFSSARFCLSSAAQSLRPSSVAQATSVP